MCMYVSKCVCVCVCILIEGQTANANAHVFAYVGGGAFCCRMPIRLLYVFMLCNVMHVCKYAGVCMNVLTRDCPG